MEATQAVSDATESVVSDNPLQELKETVSYETHKKLLGQHKKSLERATQYDVVKAELDAIKEEKRVNDEANLTEQGEYKKLLEMQKVENEKLRGEKEEHERNLLSAHKLNAFREKLPGKISHPDYYSHVDLDAIKLDAETNTIDDVSLTDTVNLFLKNHASLITTPDVKGGLPNEAPQGETTPNLSDLTSEERIKLILDRRKSQ